MNRDRQYHQRTPQYADRITYTDSRGQIIDEEDDDRLYNTRLPSSARRYDLLTEEQPKAGKLSVLPSQLPPGVVLIRGIPCANIGGEWMKVELPDSPPPATQPQRQTEDIPTLHPHRRRRLPRVHWLVFVGIALFLMIGGWVLFNVFTSWLQVKVNDAVYGRPRTYQTDAIVGHADSPDSPTHFQCINLNKHIQVIEFPGGDSSKAKVYEGPTLLGPGEELTPCIVSFRDVNGDGKPDMLLSIGGEIFVMINDGTGFRNVKPGEHVNL